MIVLSMRWSHMVNTASDPISPPPTRTKGQSHHMHSSLNRTEEIISIKDLPHGASLRMQIWDQAWPLRQSVSNQKASLD